MTAPGMAVNTVSRYAQASAQARTNLLAVVLTMWDNLGGTRDEQAEQFARQVIPTVRGSQQAIAALTAAYLSQMSEQMTSQPAPSGAPISAAQLDAIRGVPASEVYRRPFVTVYTALAQGKPYDEAVAQGRRRLQSIASTDMQLAKTHQAQASFERDGRVVGYRRVLVGDHSCGLCVVASTQRYHKGQLMPIHPGCVPGSARVRARDVEAVTRRWYSGELAVITTARGDDVTVTAKHPVLTDRGWVPAGEVREGDHLARSVDGQRVVDGRPDEGDRPAFAEDVWRSLAVAFGFLRVPLAAEDFHGDGSDGHVDVVRTDGYLPSEGHAEFRQVLDEAALVDGGFGRREFAGAGVAAPFIPGGVAATGSSVSGGRLLSSLLDGHLCGTHQASLGGATAGDTRVAEPSRHDVAADPLTVGDDVLGESLVEVVGPELLVRVAHVRRVPFSGHVYNLQTRSATYEADSHIVHNCDCAVAPIYGHMDPGQSIDTAQIADDTARTDQGKFSSLAEVGDLRNVGDVLGDVHQAIDDRFGAADAGARVMDYRKAMVVLDHGEIGPVLGVKGHDHTTEADIRSHLSGDAETVAEKATQGATDAAETTTAKAVADMTADELENALAAAAREEDWERFGVLEAESDARDEAEREAQREAAEDAAGEVLKAPADMTDDEIEAGYQQAIESEDWDRFGELEAEANSREAAQAKRDKRKARDQAKQDARDAAKWAKYEELTAQGVDDVAAIEEAYGLSPEQQAKANAVATMRGQGYVGRDFRELSRQSFADHVHGLWLQAEHDTRGEMRNQLGERKGVSTKGLFTGQESSARKYASEELLAWWDEHGRPTYAEWQAYLLGEPGAALASLNRREDFLQ